MKLDEIRNEVIGIIQDQSYSPDAVTGYINQALSYCAGVIDIPEHKRVFTVSTIAGQAYIPLQEQINSFGGRVRRAKYNGTDLKIMSSLDALLDDYESLDDEGSLEAVALEGRTLWYQKIPEDVTSILVLCYVNPEPLSKSNPEASWLPEHVQRKILVDGACSYIFDQTEEEDSNKPVTNKHRRVAFDDRRNDLGITELRSWIAKNRPSLGYSCWRF